MDISFSVNGRKYSLEVDPKESLMDILRERLDLTGTKNGCQTGHCGACTVIMNGEAVKSCMVNAKKLQDSDILTIEGISNGYHLHPIQEAFIKSSAVQCGFCTPGYIMTLYALLEKNPNAPESEIRSALKDHLCRCTGYKPILEAALLAQELQNR